MDSLYKSLQDDLEDAKLVSKQQDEVLQLENNSENFVKLLQQCLDEDYDIILELDKLLSDARYYHSNCNIAKTTGTAASCGGAGILIGSFITAPVTGGLSLVPGVIGATLSLGGGVANVLTDIIANRITKGIIDEIEIILARKAKSNSSLNNQIDNFKKILTYFGSQGISEEYAIAIILRGLANQTLDLSNLPNTNVLKTFALSAVVMHEAEDMAIKYLPKLGRFISISEKHLRLIYSFFGLTTKTGTSALKAAAGLIGVVSAGIFAVVDIAILIRDWKSYPPSEEAIVDVKKQLLDEIEKLKEIQEIIESLKDRVWYSKCIDIPIIGPSEDSVKKFVQSLENVERDNLHSVFVRLENSRVLKNIDMTKLPQLIENVDVKHCTFKVELKLSYDLIGNKINDKENVNNSENITSEEHVINQSVLYVYKDIINEFKKKRKLDGKTLPNNTLISKSINNAIENKMIAELPTSTHYIDLFAKEYMENICKLKEACIQEMCQLYDAPDNCIDFTNKITLAVKNINENSLFVDQMALRVWLKQSDFSKTNRLIFDTAESEVKHMFFKLHENLKDWMREVKSDKAFENVA